MKMMIVTDLLHAGVNQELPKVDEIFLSYQEQTKVQDFNDYLNYKKSMDFAETDLLCFGLRQNDLESSAEFSKWIKVIRGPYELKPLILFSIDSQELQISNEIIELLRDKNLCVVANLSKSQLSDTPYNIYIQLVQTYKKFQKTSYKMGKNGSNVVTGNIQR